MHSTTSRTFSLSVTSRDKGITRRLVVCVTRSTPSDVKPISCPAIYVWATCGHTSPLSDKNINGFCPRNVQCLTWRQFNAQSNAKIISGQTEIDKKLQPAVSMTARDKRYARFTWRQTGKRKRINLKGRRTVEKQDFWQQAKHTKLYILVSSQCLFPQAPDANVNLFKTTPTEITYWLIDWMTDYILYKNLTKIYF